MNSRTRTAAMAAVLLALSRVDSAFEADDLKPALDTGERTVIRSAF